MQLFFLIKEGLAGFKRARLATGISVLTMSLALTLVGLFVLFILNVFQSYQSQFQSIHLRAYLSGTLSEEQQQSLQREIAALAEVQSATIITPAAAAEEFSKDFGPELLEILDENPLPASLDIILKEGMTDLGAINQFIDQLTAREAIDEVSFQETLVRLMNRYFFVGILIAGTVGILVFAIAAMLIYNTIRLTIHSRQTVIDIMRLVGATHRFIKAPFIIEGILQGLLGSLIALSLLWLLVRGASLLLLPVVPIPLYFMGGLVLTGIGLGLIGSYMSVGNYLRL
ncbi:MAG TPA: permease-like cell division protein FtsX [Calditrichia bacterium]|nr:permease-like cell division protein FtsX [Calditrichota bacterium]HQV31901.1 permease-like cell division protein FtsX [Calditrichia bacterium]